MIATTDREHSVRRQTVVVVFVLTPRTTSRNGRKPTTTPLSTPLHPPAGRYSRYYILYIFSTRTTCPTPVRRYTVRCEDVYKIYVVCIRLRSALLTCSNDTHTFSYILASARAPHTSEERLLLSIDSVRANTTEDAVALVPVAEPYRPKHTHTHTKNNSISVTRVTAN